MTQLIASLQIAVLIVMLTAPQNCRADTIVEQKAADEIASPLVVDVKTDLIAKGIYSSNAVGDGKTDDSICIQSAIDYAVKNGGGAIIIPPGVYRVKDITIQDKISLVGAGQDKTILRAADESDALIRIKGGQLSDLTACGTPSEEKSGGNWIVGKKGIGEGGSAETQHIIYVSGAMNGAIISSLPNQNWLRQR